MYVLTGILIFLLILLLIKPIIQFLHMLWTFNLQLCPFIVVDIKEKYGDWSVITGSTDGIGKEYAKELAKRNINIVLISRNLEKLNKTKEEILTLNPAIEVKIIQADFSKGKEAIKAIQLELKNVPVGILVNNVGKLTEYPMYFDEISEDDIWDTININIAAATLMTRMVLPEMKKRRKGAIVNMGSASNLLPLPLFSVYSATKIYIEHLSDIIRAENKNSGITVQCLSPFFIKTQMIAYSSKTEFLSVSTKTYVRNAIRTLGKVDSTTGYWLHDINKILTLLLPVKIRIMLGFWIVQLGRNDFLRTQKINKASKR